MRALLALKAPLIRPSGTFSRKREKGGFRHLSDLQGFASAQLEAPRTASGKGALLPVCVSIQTTTTLPSEYSLLSSF